MDREKKGIKEKRKGQRKDGNGGITEGTKDGRKLGAFKMVAQERS